MAQEGEESALTGTDQEVTPAGVYRWFQFFQPVNSESMFHLQMHPIFRFIYGSICSGFGLYLTLTGYKDLDNECAQDIGTLDFIIGVCLLCSGCIMFLGAQRRLAQVAALGKFTAEHEREGTRVLAPRSDEDSLRPGKIVYVRHTGGPYDVMFDADGAVVTVKDKSNLKSADEDPEYTDVYFGWSIIFCDFFFTVVTSFVLAGVLNFWYWEFAADDPKCPQSLKTASLAFLIYVYILIGCTCMFVPFLAYHVSGPSYIYQLNRKEVLDDGIVPKSVMLRHYDSFGCNRASAQLVRFNNPAEDT